MDSPIDNYDDGIPDWEANFEDQLGQAAFEDLDKDPRTFHKRAPVFYPGNKTGTRPIMRLRPLQHMVILHLQRMIGKKVARLYDTKKASHKQMEEIRKLLRAYTQALQDWKFMLETPGATPQIQDFIRDLLEVKPRRKGKGKPPPPHDTSAAVLVGAGLCRGEVPIIHVSDYTGRGGGYDNSAQKNEHLRQLIRRVCMAIFGGLIMIAPMLIMTLHTGLNTSLGTTSAFVFVGGILLAYFMRDAAIKDVFAATAAYAAVLVVFVGTSQAGQALPTQ